MNPRRPILGFTLAMVASVAVPAVAQSHVAAQLSARVATAGTPVTAAVTADDLSGDPAVTPGFTPGPATARPQRLARCTPAAAPPGSGEGVVAVTMAGPGTSWASTTRSAVVVDVIIDRGAPQQVVLFDGAAPFTYTGFVGPLATGAHCVTVAVRADLSHDVAATPRAAVYAVRLGVVPRSDPAYLLTSHAPVMYGRSTSAFDDTPLLTYGERADNSDGTAALAYTVIWTHEDVGTGIVAADLWGSWGRMTDIETVLHETVDAQTGKVLKATYLSCGCEQLPVYPDISNELPPSGETQKDFAGTWYGSHAVLRDATGNNDESDSGTTQFRFQQSLAAAPSPGQTREAAMDAHPWTYRISNDEVARESATSTDPHTLLAGDYRQYLIADIDAAPTGAASVAVDVQLRGDSTWWSNDYAQMSGGVPSTYPFYTGGHGRTVIKLPTSWLRTGIAAVRLRLNVAPGATGTPTLNLHSLTLIGLTSDWEIVHPAAAAPTVTTATAIFPAAVG